MSRDSSARGAGVTAVLGPTYTGKTHLAIERMLAHSSGIIGLPLRLLAREVYNRVAERAGVDAVALITGEEKIKPPNPRYWVSTVEAMPRDLDVAFLAIDEVQLGADLDRGHVFTDRMLNRRGREETLVLGAQTVRPMVERLLPGAHVLTRPRLSQLSFSGEKKLTRLPRRSAVVTFSAEEVYEVAELIRRQRGCAAVVMGALSPRTRNAQVELYQSGDVEYLVATDAIGMGLNLDVDHVAFASDRKFDGYQYRKLNPAELAQIAGRAGRATRNGSFGTTGRCPPFETELAQALESHTFEPIKVLQWRNTALDFTSIGALQASLADPPKEPSLTRAPVGEDILVLDHASRDDDIRALATTRAAVERLWEVCQVPDYRKISPATHAELATTLYGFLMREGAIPIDWFARQVNEADHAEGDIDTLSNRIAHIRTWTFAANRLDWLADPEHWQGVTRAVEDKLSDALHERLTERFVDRRTSVLMRRLRENTVLETDIGKSGEVVVEGHAIGRLDGFMFTPDASSAGSEAKALAGAAQKALAGEINARATRLSQAADGQFVLATDGTVRWLGQPVAKLVAGEEALKPRLRIIADEHLTGAPRDGVQARLDLWLKSHIERLLEPLYRLAAAEDVTGIARGVAFQLNESLGVLDRQKVADEVKGLDQPSRATLRKYGVRFGAYHIYVPALLKPAARALASLLWAEKQSNVDMSALSGAQHLAGSGRTSFPVDKSLDRDAYRVLGYRQCGERAVRVDILERLADLIRPALSWREASPGTKPAGAFDGRGFVVTQAMTSLTGSAGEDFASILRALGYRMEKKAPLPPKPVAAEGPAAENASATEAVAETLETAADTSESANSEDVSAAPSAALLPDVAFSSNPPADEPVAVESESVESRSAEAAPVEAAPAETQPDPAPAMEAAAVEAPQQQAAAEPAPESVAASDASADTSAAEAAAPEVVAAPEMIEVWRPGGRSEERRPRHDRNRPRRHDRATQGTEPASAVAGEAGDAAKGERQRRGRRDRTPDFRKPRTDAPPAEAATAAVAADGAPASPPREDRGSRPPRERFAGKGRDNDRPQGKPQDKDRPQGKFGGGREHGGRDKGGRDKGGFGGKGGRDSGPSHRQWATSAAPRERDRPVDPNSPFAKLAALKEQLAGNRKD